MDIDEVVALESWKAQAMHVLSEWDLVFDALGKPGRLGESKATAALREIERRWGR